MKKLKTFFTNSVIIVAGTIVFSSCSKKSEQVKYIPKDANLVVKFDVKSIGAKSLNFKSLFNIENFKRTLSNVNEKDSTIEKLKNSGIDLVGTAYFFSKVNEEAKGYGALTVALTDAGKFEAFVQELDKSFTISSEGDFKFAGTADIQKAIGWNSSTAIFLMESGGSAPSKETLLSFLNLKEEETLAGTDKAFKELQKESGDISLWMNMEKLGNFASQYNPLGSALSFKETFVTAVCNFENGQIVIDSKYHASKVTAEILSLINENLSKDVSNALSGKSVVAMLGISLDMGKVYNYLVKEKIISNVEIGAQMTGLTSKELLEIFSGEFAGTSNGMLVKEGSEPKPEFSFVIGIRDKNKAASLLSKLTDFGFLKKTNEYYFNQDLFKDIFIVDKGSYLIVSGSESMRQLAVDGNGEKLNSVLSDMLTENSGAFYMNTENIPDALLASLPPNFNDYIKSAQLESIKFTALPISNSVAKGKIVIALKPKDENSLVTLAKASESFMEEETNTSVMPKMEEHVPENFGGLEPEEKILEEEIQ